MTYFKFERNTKLGGLWVHIIHFSCYFNLYLKRFSDSLSLGEANLLQTLWGKGASVASNQNAVEMEISKHNICYNITGFINMNNFRKREMSEYMAAAYEFI